jgi:phosphoribosyl-ATP pyrophosphohydrolase/phosphoribosyl-AMP cyclohydrolase
MIELDRLDWAKGGGQVTVVAQDAVTGAVLMVAAADRVALERTLASGEMHYHSRRRGLWHKGATSGNVQRVVSLTADCDGDAVLARVRPAGPACHTGSPTCFGDEPAEAFGALSSVVRNRAAGNGPAGSYTRRLLEDRNLRLKKLGEEVAELIAALAAEDRHQSTLEGADLVYHLAVALQGAGGSLAEVGRVLAARDDAARLTAADASAAAGPEIAPRRAAE